LPGFSPASRLNRDLGGSYGTKKYAFEELIAELGAAFSCASLRIVPTVRHADYIGSWLEVLREDNRAIVRAASQATKAADYLLGFLPEMSQDASTDSDCWIKKRRDRCPSAASREEEGSAGRHDGLNAEREALGCPSWSN
jgi:antirestriction protein ArdC